MEITQWIPTAFIISQMPLPDKLDIFWTMIWEQESEVIACLTSDTQVYVHNIQYEIYITKLHEIFHVILYMSNIFSQYHYSYQHIFFAA